MADSITSSSYLYIGIKNTDGYTEDNPAKMQYIKVPSPKIGLTEEQIKTAVQPGITNQIYVDDKGVTYASDSKIVTAYTDYQTVTVVDIGTD